jgi:bifunctional UDP-N-acetylglucosamine pyrophosphorylase/glucosamine-1-phosphate N-acetyltransferase
MKILGSDVGGVAAGDYLCAALSKLDGADVSVLADGDGPLAGQLAGLATVSFPFTPSVVSSLAQRAVLLIDARAWLPHRLLERMLADTRGVDQPVRLVDQRSDATGHREVSLAVMFAPGQFGPNAVQRTRTVAGRGLEHILSPELLANSSPVAPANLDTSRPPLLLDSHTDLSTVEGQVLLDRACASMEKGVRIRDPRQIWLRGELVAGLDVEIDINVIVEGKVVLGDGVTIGANCILKDSEIGPKTRINPFSLVERASIGADCIVGPYGRVRPASAIGDGVQIGNYVEIKSSEIGSRSRINHHAFIGDAAVAEDVTIGAGTITCNHDGVRVNRTIIERGAYIGSGCNLVAPLRIGERATVGAGSTITEDVPAATLTVARSKQMTIANWKGPKER